MYDKLAHDCSEYEVGKLISLSFTSNLRWKIISNESYDNGVIKYITFSAEIIPGHEIVVSSNLSNNGEFSCGCYSLGFGGINYMLDTYDPEDAIYRAEIELLKWARYEMIHYQIIYEKMLGKW